MREQQFCSHGQLHSSSLSSRTTLDDLREIIPVVVRDYHDEDDPSKRFWIRINDGWHGFFAQFLIVLNELRYAEEKRWTPYVYIEKKTEKHGDNRYFDEIVGPNIWEYYFRPVSGIQPSPDFEVRNKDQTLSWKEERQLYTSPEAIKAYYFGKSFDGINNKQRYKDNLYNDGFYWRHRSMAHKMIKDYVRIKTEIEVKVRTYVDRYFTGWTVLGVHMRGTDKIPSAGSGDVIPPREYAGYIRSFLAYYPKSIIFIATESSKLLQELRNLVIGDEAENLSESRILSRDVLRSKKTFRRGSQTLEQNIFLDTNIGGGYQKGEDVLVDALLLSQCDFLIHGASSVSEAAIWFNLGLHNR